MNNTGARRIPSLILSNRNLGAMKLAAMFTALLICAGASSQAQVFTPLHSLQQKDGTFPVGVTQGIDGNLYGATAGNQPRETCPGVVGCGTLFKITTDKVFTTLHKFDFTDGSSPAVPIQGVDGNLYGTTYEGGLHGGFYRNGTAFSLTPDGTFTKLHDFSAVGGGNPTGLIQVADGSFYGAALSGGSGQSGTIFHMNSSGAASRVYTFCPQIFPCPDGAAPSSLIQGIDGNFYGTASLDGASFGGTVFKVTPKGVLTTLHSFCTSGEPCPDGSDPRQLVALGGMFYGTTTTDGVNEGGTVFQITPNGVLTTIYSFCAEADCADGFGPTGGLIVGSEGGLYGTTQGGGTGDGTIFKITPAGSLTTLYSFRNSDGKSPSPLMQDTDGNFYGTLGMGGSQQLGMIFRFSTGLRPFVKTLQTSGKEGSSVIILGTSLTDATSVSFNGTAASFTVVSATEITATIPAGATTGKIQVGTPTGSLVSNIPFRVTH